MVAVVRRVQEICLGLTAKRIFRKGSKTGKRSQKENAWRDKEPVQQQQAFAPRHPIVHSVIDSDFLPTDVCLPFRILPQDLPSNDWEKPRGQGGGRFELFWRGGCAGAG